MPTAGKYDLRVTILARVLVPAGANNEERETWPGPGVDYYAMRDALSAGEVITQGIRQSTGSMKLRIRGRAITVSAVDRLLKTATGEEFAVTAVWREKDDTVILCDRAHERATGQ